jgi:hypothetical protein
MSGQTYNVGAINQQLQNLGQQVYGAAGAIEQGERVGDQRAYTRARTQGQILQNNQAQAAEAAVPELAQTFFKMLNPLVPQVASPADMNVPEPPRRPTAEQFAAPTEYAPGVVAEGGDSFVPGINSSGILPTVKVAPAVAPEDVQTAINGMVRLGVNNGDPNKLYNPIVEMIASLMGGYGNEAEAFKAAAMQGKSTPVGQRYTLPGAEQAQDAQRAHDLSKTEFNSQANLAATQMVQDAITGRHGRSLDLRKYLGDQTNATNVARNTDQYNSSIYRTDQTVAQRQAETAQRQAQGVTPGSAANSGIPQTPDGQAKFDYYLDQMVGDATGLDEAVDPKFRREVAEIYDTVKMRPENRYKSPATVIGNILADYDMTVKKNGWGTPNTIVGTRRAPMDPRANAPAPAPAAPAAAPPKPNAPPSASAARAAPAPATPAAKPNGDANLSPAAQRAIATVQAMDGLSDEERERRIAGIRQKDAQRRGAAQ